MSEAPREHRFQAKGAEIAWFEWGSEGDPPILLVHATGFHGRCWDATVKALPDGYRIIAVEMRGHGRSENTGPYRDWTEPRDDVLQLVEALDLTNLIGVGHSMGGHCLTQVCARIPDRFARLLLIDPVMMNPDYYLLGQFKERGKAEDFPVARRRNQWSSWQEMFERFASRHPYSLWRRQVLEDYCKYGLIPRSDGDGLELACPPIVESSVYVSSTSVNIYDLVSEIEQPVTVLRAHMRDFEAAAELDFSASPTWEHLAAQFPNGRDVYLPELSHFIPMEEPELVARYVVGDL